MLGSLLLFDRGGAHGLCVTIEKTPWRLCKSSSCMKIVTRLSPTLSFHHTGPNRSPKCSPTCGTRMVYMCGGDPLLMSGVGVDFESNDNIYHLQIQPWCFMKAPEAVTCMPLAIALMPHEMLQYKDALHRSKYQHWLQIPPAFGSFLFLCHQRTN